MSDAGVVRTHQDTARWYFQFGENCAGNVARVHITGVGNYAAERGGRRLAWREIGLDVRERSEERRVGKGCRSGGTPGHYKKNRETQRVRNVNRAEVTSN